MTVMPSAVEFQGLLDQLGQACKRVERPNAFEHEQVVFDLVFRQDQARCWIELRVDIRELDERNAVELMAAALAQNTHVMSRFVLPCSFGLLNSPSRLVCSVRLEGPCPRVSDVFVFLRKLNEQWRF